jgi:quinol monooxygenase YgiN
MSVHFLAALAGALLAAAGLGTLVVRSTRAPNGAVIAWGVALLGLTVALAAQALGYHTKFGATTFRAMEIGSQVVAPLALGFGLAEVTAKSLLGRFASRLLLSALAFVAIVVLATDPLSSATFTKVWPSAAVYYQPIPNSLLEYVLAPVTVLVALIGASVAASRQGRDPAWRAALPPAALASLAMLILAVPGVLSLLHTLAKMKVPSLASPFVLLCIAAAGATWLAGTQAGKLRLAAMRGQADAEGSRADAAGGFGPSADDEFGIYGSRRGADQDYRGPGGEQSQYTDGAGYPNGTGYPEGTGYPQGTGYSQGTGYQDGTGYGGEQGYEGHYGYPDQTDYGEQAGYGPPPGYRDDAAYQEGPGYQDGHGYPGQEGYGDPEAYPEAGGYSDEGAYPQQAGYPAGDAYPEQGGYSDESGYPQQAGYPGGVGYPQPAGPGGADGAPAMFGQIAIYTLLEERVEDFDRLTSTVVKQVRAHEPDTLVYIVHAVPSAPMQRILYEVYRDRTAYEEHRRQPYVMNFEAERRPYVLATNVIELGLQQAKVSPLPSVTDLLSDTGFDLLSDTGFGHPGYGPRHAPRHAGGPLG